MRQTLKDETSLPRVISPATYTKYEGSLPQLHSEIRIGLIILLMVRVS